MLAVEIMRFRSLISELFGYYWREEYHSLYRGFRYVEVSSPGKET